MRLFIFCRNIFVVFSVLLLSSCGTWGHYANTVSNKNPDTSVAPNQKCSNWCHNGWCSTNCESAVSNN
ncbi:MAG: hypothetical protein NTU49_10160 [Gammaproteobacteria bacterium]|nr:hypothetical protein [Gammaproteobacteria bacterium]